MLTLSSGMRVYFLPVATLSCLKTYLVTHVLLHSICGTAYLCVTFEMALIHSFIHLLFYLCGRGKAFRPSLPPSQN